MRSDRYGTFPPIRTVPPRTSPIRAERPRVHPAGGLISGNMVRQLVPGDTDGGGLNLRARLDKTSTEIKGGLGSGVPSRFANGLLQD
jgi:hypothetical protein